MMPSKELAEIVADNLKRPVSEQALLRGPFGAPNPTLSSRRPNDCFWPIADATTISIDGQLTGP
jgi:hypothetical protein